MVHPEPPRSVSVGGLAQDQGWRGGERLSDDDGHGRKSKATVNLKVAMLPSERLGVVWLGLEINPRISVFLQPTIQLKLGDSILK
jgi:hypothetical protein